MENNRIPKHAFYEELKTKKWSQHKPREKFNDDLKDNVKPLHIDVRH